jgi:hypothetical protein
MRWVLLWSVLVAGAGAFYAWLGLHLWRKGRALTRELSAATDTLAAAGDALARVAGGLERGDPGNLSQSTRPDKGPAGQ